METFGPARRQRRETSDSLHGGRAPCLAAGHSERADCRRVRSDRSNPPNVIRRADRLDRYRLPFALFYTFFLVVLPLALFLIFFSVVSPAISHTRGSDANLSPTFAVMTRGFGASGRFGATSPCAAAERSMTTSAIDSLVDIGAIPRRGPTPRSGGEGGRESRSVFPRPN
jgi:hypothetical protein